ncbi:glutathione S-transferase N-terminal domain-containing protein [Azospirillum sp. ST 5-10]|uniref:glutathione S-transferase N-terminal domain-containing protein n=1 Tax=unclassified Azospirillum TaxID=2630922 RepID=UPI003F4A2FD0
MMTLRWSATSPYVRKVMMVAIECGLEADIAAVATDPWAPDTDLPRDNPLGRVPALALEDGTVLYDSPVIAEYLDSRHGGAKLFPAAGPARWTALRLQALGDGLCDAAVARRLETMRPEGERSAAWIERQRRAMQRACDALEAEAPRLGDAVTIGTLAVVAALGYLDFRWGQEDWRPGRPALAAWYGRAAQRDSARRTAPPA